MTHQQQISLTTKGHGDMHDLTGQVAAVVDASGIKAGMVNVFNREHRRGGRHRIRARAGA
jgi:thiamine phosphate synthase YjbQ (UPF0047 family)